MQNKTSSIGNDILISQQCTNSECKADFEIGKMLNACPKCNSRLEYKLEGTYLNKRYDHYNNQWKNLDCLPLSDSGNILTLDEGGSDIIELEEMSVHLNGAKLFLMMDMNKNPTGTFKDREASLIISRCKELGLDNLVFYSTGNTGRAYTHYAAQLGLTTYFFMPQQCHYKNTDHITKKENNFIIYVDDNYPGIAPYAKKFAQDNGLNLIAPLHDRIESYTTIAYEQFEKMPVCHYFAQTIASGMGPIGYLKGHMNLVKFGLEKKDDVPRIICIQSGQTNFMSLTYNQGKTKMTEQDMPALFPSDLFEPTLNSTNPVNNYPDLYKCLKDSNGIINDVEPSYVKEKQPLLLNALQKRNIFIRHDKENSLLIGFAGLLKLADQGTFKKNEVIVLLASGRGKDTSTGLITPDAVINPKNTDPIELMKKLISKISLQNA